MKKNQNPATYMLEVMGTVSTDFHAHYNASTLCETNSLHTTVLSAPTTGTEDNLQFYDNKNETSELLAGANVVTPTPPAGAVSDSFYLTSYWHQFYWVSKKVRTSYWRTPSYNFGRCCVAILIAFIFSSAYPNQTYYTPETVIARIGVIYITTLFLGVVGMQTVMPVTADELVAYYREQQSNMYSPLIYSVCNLTVEIPYVIISSLCFVLPFFYFVGFQNVGNVPAKFGYYWLFIGLYEMTLINIGQMLIASTPSQQAAAVFAGILSTLFSMFAGFTINPADIPTFFQFVYWLDPLHYAFEGIVFTQFAGDTTLVRIINSCNK